MAKSLPPTRWVASVLIAAVFFAVAAMPCAAQIVGGWSDIPNVKDNKEVQDYGRFCVDEYNRKQSRSLVFVEVVSGQQQVVAGMNYRLRIQAVDGGATELFDAQLWVRAWLGSKDLISFKPAA